MSTDVIYARVPSELKQAAEDHAAAKGFTLTAAVSELLGLGIEAVQNARSVRALRARIATLEHELENTRAAQRQEALRREAAEQQAFLLHGAAKSWSDRAQQEVGRCPQPGCGKPIKGYDLLVSGTCPACKRTVNSMFMPETKTSRVDWNELLPILIAGGVVLGAVAATRGKA
jgi:hypothetical protein